MPKVKPNSGAKKRFQVTGTGKIKRKHAFMRHCLQDSKKSARAKRFLTKPGLVHKADLKNVRGLLFL